MRACQRTLTLPVPPRSYHPDVSHAEGAQERFHAVQIAYDTLMERLHAAENATAENGLGAWPRRRRPASDEAAAAAPAAAVPEVPQPPTPEQQQERWKQQLGGLGKRAAAQRERRCAICVPPCGVVRRHVRSLGAHSPPSFEQSERDEVPSGDARARCPWVLLRCRKHRRWTRKAAASAQRPVLCRCCRHRRRSGVACGRQAGGALVERHRERPIGTRCAGCGRC